MSRGRAQLAALLALFAGSSVGCWEQWSNDWFPQMKWQPAVQAFERTMHNGRVEPFLPPEGTLPLGADIPIDPNDDSAADALVNPRPMSLESLENGRARYDVFCSPCHGLKGMGVDLVYLSTASSNNTEAVMSLMAQVVKSRSQQSGSTHG